MEIIENIEYLTESQQRELEIAFTANVTDFLKWLHAQNFSDEFANQLIVKKISLTSAQREDTISQIIEKNAQELWQRLAAQAEAEHIVL